MNKHKTLGYGAVIVPQAMFWQGFFIIEHPKVRDTARRFLHNARVAFNVPGTKQGGVLRAMPGVRDSEQQVLGAMCASLVECALKESEAGVGSCALALRDMIKSDYFVVIGNKSAGGIHTKIETLDVQNVDEARRMIESHPEILSIKTKLLAKAMQDKKDKH